MNYPIRVLKKKFKSKTYDPYILDNYDKSFIYKEQLVDKAKNIKHQVGEVALTSVAALAVFNILLNPVMQTSAAKQEVAEIIETVEAKDGEIINSLRYDYNLVSEYTSNGVVSITITGTKEQMKEALIKSFSLTNITEVLTDGEALRVNFTAYD